MSDLSPSATQSLFSNEPYSSARQDRLRLLLVSDTHLNLERISKLVEWVVEEAQEYDFIVLSGDIINLSAEEHALQSAAAAAEGSTSSVISALESIQSKVIYIPGNHDHSSLFAPLDKRPHLTVFSRNIHAASIRVAHDLVICGFGGSCPATKDAQECWSGVPFASQATFSEAFAAAVTNWNKEIKPDDSILLVTHVGPLCSCTAIVHDFSPSPEIFTGAASISQHIQQLQKTKTRQLLANVHGHTHAARGMRVLGDERTPVVNPGSLSEGNFGVMTLRRQGQGKWMVSSVDLISLDPAAATQAQ